MRERLWDFISLAVLSIMLLTAITFNASSQIMAAVGKIDDVYRLVMSGDKTITRNYFNNVVNRGDRKALMDMLGLLPEESRASSMVVIAFERGLIKQAELFSYLTKVQSGDIPTLLEPIAKLDKNVSKILLKQILAREDYPESIADAVETILQYDIFNKAGLKPANIEGIPALIRSDIEIEGQLSNVNGEKLTNLQRMERGLAPLAKNGTPVELHYLGQGEGAPVAELLRTEHKGSMNYRILHPKRDCGGRDTSNHWKARAKQIEEQNKKTDDFLLAGN
ncbi:hypothetical protein RsTz2092_08210 [Deferribacterales bacterium RsTz2092]|nr:hypothetical protein AGMMS49941_07460 [Deferribacterales bacterium]